MRPALVSSVIGITGLAMLSACGNGVDTLGATQTLSYPQTVLAESGLIGYWRLGDIASAAQITNSAPSTPFGSATFAGGSAGTDYILSTPGPIVGATAGPYPEAADQAITLNGTGSGYIQMQGGTENFGNASTAQFTLEIWVKTTDRCSSSPGLLHRSGSVLVFISLICVNGGFPEFHLQDSSQSPQNIQGTQPINDGLWHHVVGVKNPDSTFALYVDGTQANQAHFTPNTTFNVSGGVLLIGAANGQFFNGSLSEAAFYNVALSGPAILHHYRVATDQGP